MANIVVLDIERQSAMVDGIWGLKQTWINPNQILTPPSTICFAYKYLGEPKMHFAADWKRGGHKQMVLEAWHVLDAADYVVGWNSKGFDVKHLRTEFLLAGLTPPSPHKDIDLMLTVRKNFGFLSNRMQWVAEQLGAGSKLATGGADLWRTLRMGKGQELKDARAKMQAYNEQDVHLTEELYWRLLPWVSGLNIPLSDKRSDVCCSNCGSDNIQWRGSQMAMTRSYARFQCQACGKWGRDVKADAAVASAGI
jgi:hypothetical protein